MIRSFNLFVCTFAILSSTASMCMHQRKKATSSSTSLSAPASASSPYDQMSLTDLRARETKLHEAMRQKEDSWDAEGYCCLKSRGMEVGIASLPGVASGVAFLSVGLVGEWNNYSLWLESFGCPGNATIGGQVACAIGAMCLNLIHYEQRQSVTQPEREELKRLTDAINNNPEFQRDNWKEFKKAKMQELCLAHIAGD